MNLSEREAARRSSLQEDNLLKQFSKHVSVAKKYGYRVVDDSDSKSMGQLAMEHPSGNHGIVLDSGTGKWSHHTNIKTSRTGVSSDQSGSGGDHSSLDKHLRSFHGKSESVGESSHQNNLHSVLTRHGWKEEPTEDLPDNDPDKSVRAYSHPKCAGDIITTQVDGRWDHDGPTQKRKQGTLPVHLDNHLSTYHKK